MSWQMSGRSMELCSCKALCPCWLGPDGSRISKIDIQWGDNPEIRVDGIGEATLKPFQDGAGKTATLTGAAAQAAFHIDSMRLASARTGSWSDPDLGSWESDSATLHSFSWAA